ncbi:hypothetical protein ACFOPX_04770 [Helicobacter baculiformis]|uniref:Uncharacterized protein n=1 Tax=Helicobacter baculiformis TaxID=427351 RepID=A0ABV7ZKZ3_9HELI|nr:hypothetical protein [Helicobacter baculiformis]
MDHSNLDVEHIKRRDAAVARVEKWGRFCLFLFFVLSIQMCTLGYIVLVS